MMRTDRLRRRKDVDHLRRNHQISQPHGWKHDGAETAAEDHHACAIQSLQGGYRTPRVAVLAVVVVFENHYARFARPLEQCQPSPKTHGDTKRELMGGRDVDKFRLWPAFDAALQI